MACLDAVANPGGGCIIGGYHDITLFGASQYFNVFVDNVTTDNNINVATLLPQSAIAQNLFVQLDAPPTAGQTFTVNLLLNGVASGLSVVISGATNTTGSNTTTRIVLPQGAAINFETIASGGCLSNWFRVGCLLKMITL